MPPTRGKADTLRRKHRVDALRSRRASSTSLGNYERVMPMDCMNAPCADAFGRDDVEKHSCSPFDRTIGRFDPGEVGRHEVEVLQMLASIDGTLAAAYSFVASYGGGSTTSGGSGGSGYTTGGSGYGSSYGPVFWISAVVIALVVIGVALFLWRRHRSRGSTTAAPESRSTSYRDRAA